MNVWVDSPRKNKDTDRNQRSAQDSYRIGSMSDLTHCTSIPQADALHTWRETPLGLEFLDVVPLLVLAFEADVIAAPERIGQDCHDHADE